MSHTDHCPDRWQAEREGERAQEFGRGRSANPYAAPWHSGRGCEEAERSWSDGYRRAEIREEEQREEDAARHRAERRRAEEAAEYEYYAQQDAENYAQAQEYYAMEDERVEAALEPPPEDAAPEVKGDA